MVFDVAAHLRIRQDALELVKEVLGILAEDVDQHIQPAPVSHADDRLHAAVGAEPLECAVQHGDQALSTFQTESLGARIARVEVFSPDPRPP